MAAVQPAASAAELQPSRRARLSEVAAYWPLWLIVAAGIFLRLYQVDRLPGLIGDEAWYGVQAQRLLAGTLGDLRTPTGNVPGLIQMGSLALLHALFEPSVLLLRVPSLLSSLAAMGVAYGIGRRFFGPVAAMSALALMAALPINIAYARFGWDPSHAPLLILLAIYATLSRRRLLAALIFALALSNHPAAVFVAPFLTLACLGIERENGEWRSAIASAIGFAALLALAILLSFQLSPGASHYLSLTGSIARLADGGRWLEFAAGFCRLLSGDTIYRFLLGAGFGDWRWLADAAIGLTLVSGVATGLVLVRRRPDWCLAGILSGWLVSLALLYIIAGPWVVRPVFERFSLPMVPLTVMAVATILGRLFGEKRPSSTHQALLAVLCVPLLAGFWSFYLRPLDLGLDRRDPTGSFGLPEANLLAADQIATEAGSRTVNLIAEDWWIYWPVAYRLSGRPVVMVNAGKDPAKALDGRVPAGSYWISYQGSRLDQQLSRNPDVQSRGSVKSRNGRYALRIWRSGARASR